MGLVVKQRRKYLSHKKRWSKDSIVSEADLVRDYALKNKVEIRRVEFLLSKYKDIAKELNRTTDSKQSEGAKNFLSKLKAKGFLRDDQNTLDDVLDMKLRDLLERRLSNLVYKHKLSRTPKQARQFVVHGHVRVNGELISSPSYLVGISEEAGIEFCAKSALFDENHPERNLESQHGLKEELKAQEEISLKVEEGPSFDEKEEMLDDEGSEEVER